MQSITQREEIIICTLIFSFCVFTVPMIIFTRHAREVDTKLETSKYDRNEIEFRRKVFIDSIGVLDELNRQSSKDGSKRDYGFSSLLKITEKEFHSLCDRKISAKTAKKQIRRAWRKFAFKNGTMLRSKSLKIPLIVDW